MNNNNNKIKNKKTVARNLRFVTQIPVKEYQLMLIEKLTSH